jgi:hypothetical protein
MDCIDKLTDVKSFATNLFIGLAIPIGISYCTLLRNLYNQRDEINH